MAPLSNEQFQARVLEDLATLKAEMHSLVGNGQPGRIANIESDVKIHGRILNGIIGVLIFVSTVAGILWK